MCLLRFFYIFLRVGSTVTVFMAFPLPGTLVKTLAKQLVKNLAKILAQNLEQIVRQIDRQLSENIKNLQNNSLKLRTQFQGICL